LCHHEARLLSPHQDFAVSFYGNALLGSPQSIKDSSRILIKAKLEDGLIKPREVITPPPVIDLMAALKRLAPDTPAISGTTAKESEPSPKPRSLRGHRPLWRELRSSHRGYF
jgi:hypothetical protein